MNSRVSRILPLPDAALGALDYLLDAATGIIGNDYYAANERLLINENEQIFAGDVFGYCIVTKDYYSRFNLPAMNMETNIIEPDAEKWMWRTWTNIQRLRHDGVPVCGMTWYSLTDQIDWDTALREYNSRVHTVGFFNLDRKIRLVGAAYKRLIEQWNFEPLLPNGPLTLFGQWNVAEEQE